MTLVYVQPDIAQLPLIDPFARAITYLRVSVTDRCDFRCVYCMPETMTFLPKADVLSLEELERLCGVFIGMGVKRLRLTGGEPLVRRDVLGLIRALGRRIGPGGLEELTLTTNGSQLARFADDLVDAGVRRINVSIDTLDPEQFTRITRWGRLEQVMEGLQAAKAAGLGVKINMVALKGVNDTAFDAMIRWCGEQGHDLTLIEAMPVGLVDEDRFDQYLSLEDVYTDLASRWTLTPSPHRTGGPARYFTIAQTGRLLGLITPNSHNFCENCNRVRLTCTGQLYMCLGQDDHADMRAALRETPDDTSLAQAVRDAIARKPKGHDFIVDRRNVAPRVARRMNMTGG